MTTVDELQNLSQWRRLVLLFATFFGLVAGLCTVFALVVTAGEGWQEHTQAQWPEATALVQRCDLEIYSHKQQSYWINCSISYIVGVEEIVSHVHSRSTPAPQRIIWQDPPRQFERMQEWVIAHPERTPIAVHYDPANPRKAVLVATDMPLGGPHTPSNLKLLKVVALGCMVLLAIARIARPRSAAVSGGG